MATLEHTQECPTYADNNRFFVKATQEIRTDLKVIRPGEFVLIDPDVEPAEGKWVLCGMNLERWNGQANVAGVAVSVSTVYR